MHEIRLRRVARVCHAVRAGGGRRTGIRHRALAARPRRARRFWAWAARRPSRSTIRAGGSRRTVPFRRAIRRPKRERGRSARPRAGTRRPPLHDRRVDSAR
ncbi:MAG: hypothetical protein FJ297_15155 [Planctomycetes bacterium]|nr:hypothetical protein [Planctomycetota bacterium]